MKQKSPKKVYEDILNLPPELNEEISQSVKIGYIIANEIRKRGYTLEEFSKITGIKEFWLRKVILGEKYNISTLLKIAKHLDMKVDIKN